MSGPHTCYTTDHRDIRVRTITLQLFPFHFREFYSLYSFTHTLFWYYYTAMVLLHIYQPVGEKTSYFS